MVFDKVAQTLAEFKGIDAAGIAPETTFAQFELDSLDRVQLIMNLEETFGIQIDMESRIECVRDLVEIVEKQLSGGAA
ncbi:MAG: Acyl carrier protein [Firmicutes bacterium ADurb.Bin248]|nr:MAG: Acyl carrier protein [Firmicutes bacterium ADurb.Bin248]HPK16050.1 acyl carrier protein [Clostridia bacterium]